MLEALLHHKKEEKEYLCALVVTEDRVDSALWEATKDGKVSVLKTSQKPYQGEWESAVDAADSAISEIEDALPEGAELTKVVFGLFPEWLIEDRIKDAYLKKLKTLTTSLSLTPLGFVELPIAVVHLMQKDEGTQQTVILVGMETKHGTVSIFKIGKLVGSRTFERTAQSALDIEKELVSFTDLEVLPSRVLIYGTSTDLEQIKADCLNHPWQKKAAFLHFPKIEILPIDFPVRAVAYASATELMPQTEVEADSIVPPDLENTSDQTESEEVATIAEDLGFVKDRDIVEDQQPTVDVTEERELENRVQEIQNVVPVEVPKRLSGQKKPTLVLPKFSLPKVTLTFKLPQLSKIGLVVLVLVVLFIITSAGVLGFWIIPKATVNVLVSPQLFNRTETITVDEAAAQVDADNRILPGKTVTEEVSGTKSIPASGKKTVGDRAHGETTIYNKTLNTKVFKKGTTLTAGKLKFTLDDEVTVASASEGVGSLTYGTTKANITASDIGSTSNVAAGTEFSFSDLPTSSYSARNDKALSGGTSKDVLVVSRDDQKKVHDAAISELEQKAQIQLKDKLTSSEKLLENFLQSKVIKEIFGHEIGEEADEISVDMTVSSIGITYKTVDFDALLEKIVTNNIPPNYEYKKEDAMISVEDAKEDKDGVHVLTTKIEIKLLPKVEVADLAKKLAGRPLSEATEYMRSQTSVSGVEFDIDTPISAFKNKLPANPKNIKIQISSL